jgi:hypothetical protein
MNVTNNSKSSSVFYYKLAGETTKKVDFLAHETKTISDLGHVDNILSLRTILHLTATTTSLKFRSVDTSKEIARQTDGFFSITD